MDDETDDDPLWSILVAKRSSSEPSVAIKPKQARNREPTKASNKNSKRHYKHVRVATNETGLDEVSSESDVDEAESFVRQMWDWRGPCRAFGLLCIGCTLLAAALHQQARLVPASRQQQLNWSQPPLMPTRVDPIPSAPPLKPPPHPVNPLPFHPPWNPPSLPPAPLNPPSPNPAPPPPVPPPPSLVRINARFEDLESGVLIHQFDAFDSSDPDHEPWKLGRIRKQMSDRISATLINRGMEWGQQDTEVPLYSNVFSGYVLSPSLLDVEGGGILCAYDSDGGTDKRTCDPPGVHDKCIPGCNQRDHVNSQPQWCTPTKSGWPCAWQPDQLPAMLHSQRQRWKSMDGNANPTLERYNEVVLSSTVYHADLPSNIEAVFYIASSGQQSCTSTNHWLHGVHGFCEQYARRAHLKLLAHFGLSADELPLLRLNPTKWASNAPFELMSA